MHRELRDFTLSDYGPARITETEELTGPEDADYRDYYSGDTKKIRENSEQYVKEMYLADSLTSLDHGDLSDLEKPAEIKFVTTGRRADTYLSTAVMAIRTEALFNSLPKYFSTKPDDQDKEQSATDNEDKPRTADWWLTPFTTEWHYRIVAPPGFRVRALPTDKADKVGILNFSQKYSANTDGSAVEAVLRVENNTTRLSAQEGSSLRDAVLRARNSDPIFITFDHEGKALISAGHIKEGLALYRRIAEEHPKSALEEVRLAQGLLDVGLGEEARSVAQQATQLDPKSALAFSVLGNALKHDPVGRPVEKGMDYEGAIAAYKKSLELDPKDKETRANLALLMEYNPAGIRYEEGAHLMDAVSEWRKLKEVDEEYSKQYDDNSLYDLWYAHEYQKLLEVALALPTSDVRKGFILAVSAVQDGPDAALKRSTAMSADDSERSKALIMAGNLLIRVRKYGEASALIRDGALGQSNESQLLRTAEIFNRTKPYEQLTFDAKDPRAVVQKLYTGISNAKLTIDEFKPLAYRTPYDDDDFDPKPFQLTMMHVQAELRSTGLPLTTLADMTLSNMHYTIDGDDSLGYKITIESPGAAAQQVYVVRDGTIYKVLAFSVAGNAQPNSLGFMALRELDKNNLAAARTWLDRARDEIHASGGDDPLAGAIFPRLWSKGQDGDATAIRNAALVLIPPKQAQGPYLAALEQARSSAKSDSKREDITLALARAYSAQEHWENVLPLANELMKASPDSLIAFSLATGAYAQLHRFDDWQKLVDERMKQHPDEVAYVRSSAALAAYRGKFADARAILKSIMDKGRSNALDLNQYSWYELMLPGTPGQDSIDAAQRANELTKGENFAILHTFACVEAQAGNPSAARELLLKGMQAEHADEPDSALWFGFGLIAEQYGELNAAKKLYSRVEKDNVDSPASSYVIAQQHMLAIQKSDDRIKVAKQ